MEASFLPLLVETSAQFGELLSSNPNFLIIALYFHNSFSTLSFSVDKVIALKFRTEL